MRKEDLRLGKDGIKTIKNHPWFKDINWTDLVTMRVKAPFIPHNVLKTYYILD